ncbi:hypothetical protein [Bradyrhizobium lablabi]|uniref:hypothetical protein n=1 Tax=Bradyrhizobium lablabi TaxID=722472 RepID=UPI001FCDA5E9|nr:hypothetical protein [Bradyrhizobium lablabi]
MPEHRDPALIGGIFARFLGRFGPPVLEIDDLDLLAATENQLVRDVANVELRIIIVFELRIEPRRSDPSVLWRPLDDDLAQRLREARDRARVRAIVGLGYAAIDAGFINLHFWCSKRWPR